MNRPRSLSRGLPRASSRGGFTLIEVLVSCAIVAAVVLGLSGVFKGLAGASIASSQLTTSTISAMNVMEDLRSRSFAELPSFNNSTFDNGRGRIQVSPAGNDLLLITVTNKVELVTMRSRYD